MDPDDPAFCSPQTLRLGCLKREVSSPCMQEEPAPSVNLDTQHIRARSTTDGRRHAGRGSVPRPHQHLQTQIALDVLLACEPSPICEKAGSQRSAAAAIGHPNPKKKIKLDGWQKQERRGFPTPPQLLTLRFRAFTLAASIPFCESSQPANRIKNHRRLSPPLYIPLCPSLALQFAH